ncbi:conserved hypothetical protein [Histoplasma capsulatum var. duboisii H88]|uniref:Uncharacterized protein n=1 Tax=Ajellomyces capsulatus (strain H88) TaxID=544711 RepID=F0U805_AJEC8|nr:conserved hypothetical protein [Histoplasma capsulatum var. duboisii H88]
MTVTPFPVKVFSSTFSLNKPYRINIPALPTLIYKSNVWVISLRPEVELSAASSLVVYSSRWSLSVTRSPTSIPNRISNFATSRTWGYRVLRIYILSRQSLSPVTTKATDSDQCSLTFYHDSRSYGSKTVTNQLRDSLHDLNGPLDELKDKWDCDRLSPTLHWRLASCRGVLSLVPQDEIGTGKNDKMLKSGKSRCRPPRQFQSRGSSSFTTDKGSKARLYS